MNKENGNEVVFLRGARVNMRPLCTEDAPLLVKWVNDPDVRRYISIHWPHMVQHELDFIERVAKEKSSDVVLMMVVEGVPIGVMGLHQIDLLHGHATTGAFIGESEYRGKGYAQEAKMLLLEYAFHTLNLRKVYSDVIAFNDRSFLYLSVSGYVEYGRKKKHWYRDGAYHDLILVEVWRERWEKVWKKYVKKYKIPTCS